MKAILIVLALYAVFTLVKEPSDIPVRGYAEEVSVSSVSSGSTIVREYIQDGESAPAEAYVLHITDQDGNPVPGVMVNFCTDVNCTMLVSDENGLVTFSAAPENYHVQLLKAPEGCSFDPAFEFWTGDTFGEWIIAISRD